jgi:hypothetical protein
LREGYVQRPFLCDGLRRRVAEYFVGVVEMPAGGEYIQGQENEEEGNNRIQKEQTTNL